MALVDHSDADIMLSHFQMRHARDRKLIRENAALFQATALYNDYPWRSKGNVRTREETRIFFFICQDIENKIASGALEYHQGFEQISIALALIHRLRHALPEDSPSVAERLASAIQAGSFTASPEENQLLQGFLKYFRATSLQGELLKGMAQARGGIESLSSLPSNTFLHLGIVSVLYVADETLEIESSEVARFLNTEGFEASKGPKIVLTIVKDRQTGAQFIKMRTLDPGVSLNSLYPVLVSKGLDAGGREAAGAPAYGKFGAKGLARSQVLRDLEKIIEAIRETYPELDCSRKLRKTE